MCSGRGNEPLRPLGFPIRKSPDQCLVTDSPGLIAGSYVLHRLLVPRHPPCALNNLTLQMRCSRPLCSSQDTGGTGAPARYQAKPPARKEGKRPQQGGRSLRTQQRARPRAPPGPAFLPQAGVLTSRAACPGPNNQCSTNEQPPQNIRLRYGSGRDTGHTWPSAPVAP